MLLISCCGVLAGCGFVPPAIYDGILSVGALYTSSTHSTIAHDSHGSNWVSVALTWLGISASSASLLQESRTLVVAESIHVVVSRRVSHP